MQPTELTTQRQDNTTPTALLAGPALIAGYGVVRLSGRAVGDYGPGVMPAVYTVVPTLFWLGLLALVSLLAFFRRGEIPGWSPLLMLAGTVMMAMSLDLLAAGALCIGPVLFLVRRGLRG